jgi:hypothetical protein
VIIQSNEGICFHVSLGLLVKYSSFFDHLALLSGNLPTGEKAEVLELPSASTEALRMVLPLLRNSTVPDSFIRAVCSDDYQAACDVIKDLAILIDAYDLPQLAGKIFGHLSDSVWLQYSFAAITGDEARAKVASQGIVLLDKGYYPVMIPMTIRIFLADHAVAYRERLDILIWERCSAWNECKIAMRHTAPIFNNLDNFSRKCRQRGGCAAVLNFNGSFKKMRRRAAYVAIKAIEHSPALYELSADMGPAVCEEVGCRSCSFRMVKTFEMAITGAFRGVGKMI